MSVRGPAMILRPKELRRSLVPLVLSGVFAAQTARAEGESKTEEPPGKGVSYLKIPDPAIRSEVTLVCDQDQNIPA